MPRRRQSAMLPDLLEKALRAGFRRAYFHVQVDPERYLQHVRRAYGLRIQSWGDMQGIDEATLNPIALRVIKSAKRTAALEGTGLAFGGLLTILPDMGILSAITIRMLQRLSLIYGFEYSTEEEVTNLWVAAASAAGLDLGREFLEKQAIERVVPRIIDRIAAKVGVEVAEKWSGRLIPVLSAGVGGSLNYFFVRSWGRRAQRHFLDRHRDVRTRGLASAEPRPILLNPIAGRLNS
jgi:EcsC family protein